MTNALPPVTDFIEKYLGKTPLGATWDEWMAAGLVMLGALVVMWLVRPVFHYLARQGERRGKSIRAKILDAVRRPLRFLPLVIGGYIALHVLNLSGKPSQIAGLVLQSAIVASLFWALARFVSSLEHLWDFAGNTLEPSAKRWLAYATQALIVLCGAAIILQLWDIPVAPLIGSLGVFGIAVGLAAKDLVGNLISGILIMTEKRFRPGEWIKVDGVVEGTVEQIDFRSTRIRRFDLSPVYVPNSHLADNAMTNYSRMTYRRIYWMIGLEYGTPPDKLAQIRDGVEAWLQEDDRICQPPEALQFVRIDSFGDSSINLMIYCFTKSTVWADWLKVKEDFALAMIPIVKGAGSGFAFPSRSLFIHAIDPPEIVNPETVSS